MVRDIGGGEVMETRWRPPTKAEVREIVRRYHEVQSKVPRFKTIEFETAAAPSSAFETCFARQLTLVT